MGGGWERRERRHGLLCAGGDAIALLGEIASMFLGAACRWRFGDVDGEGLN